jgi:hypothetical protein
MQRDLPDGSKTMKTTRAGDPSMTLRLVLVSMVAALGLTIPSRVECKRFLGLAEARASSFLAGWDTWRPSHGAGHKKPRVTAIRECELCRLARVGVASRNQKPAAEVPIDSTKTSSVVPPGTDQYLRNVQPPPATVRAVCDAVITFEPIEVGDEINGGLAFELNHQAEGIDLVGNSIVSGTTRIAASAVAPSENVDLEWVDKACGELIREVQTAAMAAQPSSPAALSLASTLSGDQSEPPTAPTGSDNQLKTPFLVASTRTEWSAGYGPDLFAAIEDQLAQIDESTKPPTAHEAAGLPFVVPNTQPSVVTLSPATTVLAQSDVGKGDIILPPIPWPIFAPHESDVQAETSVANEIQVPWPVFAPSEPASGQANAFTTGSSDGSASLASTPSVAVRSETVNPAMTSSDNPAPGSGWVRSPSTESSEPASSAIDNAGLETSREAHSRDNRWGEAVHLTRKAVVAWMKVLTGPAVVKVSAQ